MDVLMAWTVTMIAVVAIAYFAIRSGLRRNKVKTYQVWLKGMAKFVEVKAYDVTLEVDSDFPASAFWAFYDGGVDGLKVTLHVFPFAVVEYIVSVSE